MLPKFSVPIWWLEEHGFDIDIEAASEEDAASLAVCNLDSYLEHHFKEVCWDNEGLNGYHIGDDIREVKNND